MATCESCNKRISGTVHQSGTGRQLCGKCNDRLLGQTAGITVGGPTISDKVGSAVAIEG